MYTGKEPSEYQAYGRSYCYITCPYCQEMAKAYIWSLSGGGKKCSCGALHGPYGYTLEPHKPGPKGAKK